MRGVLGESGEGLGGLGASFGGCWIVWGRAGPFGGVSWPLLSPSSQFLLALGPLMAALGSLLVVGRLLRAFYHMGES